MSLKNNDSSACGNATFSLARSVPSDDKYRFQRTYPQPMKYAPITGYFSWYSQTGVERSQNSVQ